MIVGVFPDHVYKKSLVSVLCNTGLSGHFRVSKRMAFLCQWKKWRKKITIYSCYWVNDI